MTLHYVDAVQATHNVLFTKMCVYAKCNWNCLENVKSTSMEYGSSKYLVQKYFRVK